MSVPVSSAGYSGTPLAKKLGIGAGATVLLIEAPAELRDWLGPLPPDVRFAGRLSQATDVVHLFATTQSRLKSELVRLRKGLRSDAALWVSWPKKAAKVETDITEDAVRALALPLGFVDVKVCAVSGVWSGLKLVVRKSLRRTGDACAASVKS
jgi:choline dehydrogenase-like flavoprotein